LLDNVTNEKKWLLMMEAQESIIRHQGRQEIDCEKTKQLPIESPLIRVRLVSKAQRAVCCVVRASLGSILLSILSSAIVWLQTPQLEKK